MPTIKPRFEVHKLNGTEMRKVCSPKYMRNDDDSDFKLDKDGNKVLAGGFDYDDVEVDAGWMVYFPSGSSIHVWTEDEMERQGFLRDPELVDMETGEVAGIHSDTSFKSKSERVANRSRSSRVAQT